MLEYRNMVPGFKKLCAAFNKELSEPQAVIYAAYLSPFHVAADDWETTVQQAILTCKFFPSISELVRARRDWQRRQSMGAGGGSMTLAAATEWLTIKECFGPATPASPGRIDRRLLVSSLTPVGFEAACLAEIPGAKPDALHPGRRKQFMELYAALDEQGELAPVRRLPAGERMAVGAGDE